MTKTMYHHINVNIIINKRKYLSGLPRVDKNKKITENINMIRMDVSL